MRDLTELFLIFNLHVEFFLNSRIVFMSSKLLSSLKTWGDIFIRQYNHLVFDINLLYRPQKYKIKLQRHHCPHLNTWFKISVNSSTSYGLATTP